MKEELISIILPVYNGQEYLHESILSCLNQTYTNFELIIVNDASTDNSLRIASECQLNDDRIIIINNITNCKLPASLNIGHKAAKGDYITWTSDDNILKNNFLERLYDTIIATNSDVVYSNFDVIWQNGSYKREQISGPAEGLVFGNTIGASFLYKKKVYQMVGGYNENLFLAEDYHFFLMASLKARLYHLDENLFKYRIHSASLSGSIQQNPNYRDQHSSSVLSMFKNLGKETQMNRITINFLSDFYMGNSISLINYLKNKKIIENDIRGYQNMLSIKNAKRFDFKKIMRQKLRQIWMQDKNFFEGIFPQVITKDWRLLFGDKNNYLKIVHFLFKS